MEGRPGFKQAFLSSPGSVFRGFLRMGMATDR